MKSQHPKELRLTIYGKPYLLTARLVGKAMKDFNKDYRLNGQDSGTLYAVFDKEGMPYPPKRILSIATGAPISRFSGGTRINDAFKQLGCHVGKAPRAIRTGERWPRTLPPLAHLLRRLFSQKWLTFDLEFVKKLRRRFDAKYPGVYLFAYPGKGRKLQGKKVQHSDIMYVGMSNYAGVSPRLRQFWDGTQRGGCHVAADRFFQEHGKYLPNSRPLYVSWLSIPCNTGKRGRSAEDLRKMGAVADLELCAVARVKQARGGSEPKWNKK